jgi:peptide chain release factor 1
VSLENKFDQILKNFEDIESKLSEGISDPKKFAKYSKEFAELSPIAEKIKQLFKRKNELADLDSLINSDDQEIKEMAKIEKESLLAIIPELEKELKFLLIPKDEEDEKNAIIEIRAGTGGEEAALFAADLFRMYNRYAEIHKWKSEVIDISETDHDGIKEIIINISGKNVFGRLKFESGTHRVQRVPETESGGRIHTSAATVAVLPEATDIDIEINEKDLRIDIFRSSGPGGQSVNTTDSAVRITHIPTGVISQCQDEKSQHKNKAKALTVLRSRIYEAERMKKDKERAQDRKSQVGSGDRSERIRTYNYPQGRVTDHRISLTLYKLEQILKGESLDEVIDALRSDDNAKKLSSIDEG